MYVIEQWRQGEFIRVIPGSHKTFEAAAKAAWARFRRAAGDGLDSSGLVCRPDLDCDTFIAVSTVEIPPQAKRKSPTAGGYKPGKRPRIKWPGPKS